MSVVPARVADAATIAAMHAACFEDRWSHSALETLLQQPGVFAVLALSSDEPVGFGLCRVAAEECEVLSCAVMPRHRRRGIGLLMIRCALAEAASRGGVNVFLEVAEGNDPARRLYARLGLHAVGRRHRYYHRSDGEREDALILLRES